MTDDDDDRTVIRRVSAVDDEATTISRAPAVDDEATTISRGPAVDDEATTISREPFVDDEATTISRGYVDDEATTISHGAAQDLDDRTVIRGQQPDLDDRTVIRGQPTDLDDRTAVSPGRVDQFDDATQIRGTARPGVDYDTKVAGDRTPRGPRASAPAPGRLSGGRVAVVPGEKVERYRVRDTAPAIDNVVRTVIAAPVSQQRQSRNTVAIEAATRRSTTSRGIGVIIAIVAVTVVTVAIVAGVLIALFVL